jgi:glycosyltransferase involved in cell wall biosynthesis
VRLLLDVSAVPLRPAGAGVYTWHLVRELGSDTDLDLHLLTRRDDVERWADVAPKAELHPEVPAGRPARLLWEQASGPALADRVRADVWHGPHYTMPLRARVPAIVTVHDLTFFDHPEWHERTKVLYFRQMIRASARRADAIVCVSEYTAKRLAALAPPCGPVHVACHGVDHDRFCVDGDEPDDLRRLAAHGISPPFVACVGTVEPRKDLTTLVAAFASIARDHPDLRLALVGGDGWGVEPLRDAIAASRVATRVIRTGYVPDEVVPALYRRAVAVAYPSREEGFGVPALEALACGAPLVTTTGSAPEQVVGEAAVKVPPGDAGALTSALRSLIENSEVGTALRAAGPRQASEFTWEASAAAHLDVYRRAWRARVAA